MVASTSVTEHREDGHSIVVLTDARAETAVEMPAFARQSPRPESAPPRTRPLAWTLLIAALGGVAWVLWARGASFYRLDHVARVDHPDYRVLSPGYATGHAYGLVAGLLVVVNLSYLLRRLVPRWRLGGMGLWLELHATTGLVAGLFAVSHSALQMRSPLAVLTMAAMAVTLVTGVVGRCIHWLVPEPDLRRLAENCRALDGVRPGLGIGLRMQLERAPLSTIKGRVTVPRVLRLIPRWREEARLRKRLVFDLLAPYAAAHRAEFLLLADRIEETALIAANVPLSIAFDHLLRSWRGLHRFAAMLMLVTVVLHAVVAWYYGYRWIFSAGG